MVAFVGFCDWISVGVDSPLVLMTMSEKRTQTHALSRALNTHVKFAAYVSDVRYFSWAHVPRALSAAFRMSFTLERRVGVHAKVLIPRSVLSPTKCAYKWFF